jgi:hypothetical protein
MYLEKPEQLTIWNKESITLWSGANHVYQNRQNKSGKRVKYRVDD